MKKNIDRKKGKRKTLAILALGIPFVLSGLLVNFSSELNKKSKESESFNFRSKYFLNESRGRFSTYGLNAKDACGLYEHRATWRWEVNLEDRNNNGYYDCLEDRNSNLKRKISENPMWKYK
ncbi:MAG: hypothetical protein U9Q99_00185 [Nanoarchaeota archaeon]|nr:hypothetical protein [Nanoarchaeota archaeon]